MPNYDYECLKCGKIFEVFQSMKDEKLTDCREDGCDGAVRRLLGTGGAVIFKGSGFYQTDYRSDSYKSGEKADKPAEKPSSSGDAKKSEKPKPTAKSSGDQG